MALKQCKKELPAKQLNDPCNHQFWLKGGKLYHRHRNEECRMEVKESVPYATYHVEDGRRVFRKGGIRVLSVNNTRAVLALRLKSGAKYGIKVDAGSVVTIVKGRRHRREMGERFSLNPMGRAEAKKSRLSEFDQNHQWNPDVA